MSESTQQKTYTILPGPSMGLVSSEYLEAVALAVRRYNIPLLKITSSQRLAVGGHDPEATAMLLRSLGVTEDPPKISSILSLQACPGAQWCKHGRQDTLHLGRMLEQGACDLSLPAKIKIGVSGCGRNCCESYVRDVGLFGKNKGWTLIFGGNAGGSPRIGNVIAENLSDEQAVALACKCLVHYGEKAGNKERTARFMERCELAQFKKAVFAL